MPVVKYRLEQTSEKTEKEGRRSSNKVKQQVYAIPWLAIFALGMGMLVYGVAESYGPVVTISSFVPSQYYYVGLSLSFIAGGFGALLAGFLTDVLGRKMSFLVVAAMVLTGIAIFLIAPTNIVALVISFVLVGMAAIGMETPVLTALSEMIPSKWRGNILVIIQNFGNIGVAIVFIPAMLGFSIMQDKIAYAILFLAPLFALILGYWAIKETQPWSAITGKISIDVSEAWKAIEREDIKPVSPNTGMSFRYIFLTIIGIVQDVAFVWITYDIGYLYFSTYSEIIPIVGGLAMAIVGIAAGMLVHRFSRKQMLLISYGSLAIFWMLFLAYVNITGSLNGLGLLILAAVLFIPVELTWGVRAMLEPELFPTKSRGRWISYARMAVWVIAGVITLLLSIYFAPPSTASVNKIISYFNLSSAIVMLIFLVAVALSIIWYYKGFETGSRSLLGHDIKHL
ncbi:MAG: MFS transporter [Candidatus Brockarchaeota archaeon]|nr:MFS transporter [Candidatus Brockarchaeota archaeon]